MKRLLLLPFLLSLGGCGLTSETKQAPLPPRMTERPATARANDATSAEPTKQLARDRVIAARVSTMEVYPVRLQIVHLDREGSTTSLGLRLTSRATLGPYVSNRLDDGVTQPVRNSDSQENGSSLDGIYLIDRTHGEKYLVARDADNRCICDSELGDTRLTNLGPLHLSATFGAPPDDVTAVDVFVPHFGIFANVPLG